MVELPARHSTNQLQDRIRIVTRVVYLSEEEPAASEVSLRSGEAGFLIIDEAHQFVAEPRMQLSANTTHALLGHGVVAQLNELPLQGRLGAGLDVIIAPGELDRAIEVLYEADTKTYGAEFEFVIAVDAIDAGTPDIEYRIQIDNREYQHALSGLQYLLRTAAHEGMAAWIRI